MKKFKSSFLVAAIMSMLITVTAIAVENGSAVVHTYTGDDSISVYVRGVDSQAEVSAQVGTAEAVSIAATDISELDTGIETLIMIDNSYSIKDSDRNKIKELVEDIVGIRLPNEKVAIATFSEEMIMICDYSSDYTELNNAIKEIEFKDQETYFTDVLWNYLTDQYGGSEDVYKRIIVISDGVDNKPVDSSKKTPEQLKSLLQEYSIPLYAIGCYDKKKTNGDMLMNMKDISTLSGGSFFVFDDYEDTMDIAAEFKGDQQIVRYEIVPANNQMDGSLKAVKLTIGGETISFDCRVPQKVQEEKEPEVVETIVVVTAEPAEVSAPVEEVEEEEPEEEETPAILLYGLIAGAVVIFIAIVVLVVILIVRSNKKKNTFETLPDDFVDNRNKVDTDIRTELVDPMPRPDNDGGTVMIWNNPQTYHIILTDVMSPARTFQIPLTNSVVLGRKIGCDAVFDYEKSVSSRHCEISVKSGKFYLKDLQSSNGTFINGSKVLTEVEIFAGNIIKMGRLEIKFDVR